MATATEQRPAAPSAATQEVRDRYRDGIRYWGPIQQAAAEELEFGLDGKHYDEEEARSFDPNSVRPVGRETFNAITHKAAQCQAVPLSFEARPVDQMSDPDDAELATSLIEWELHHPQKGFEEVADDVITGALAARYWMAMLDFDPHVGPFGEILFRACGPDEVIWEAPYRSPHHLRCGWMINVQRPTIEEAKRWPGLKHTEHLQPDSEGVKTPQVVARGGRTPLPTAGAADGAPGPMPEDGRCTLWFCWDRNDPATMDKERREDYRRLEPGARYMTCGSIDEQGAITQPGCGWRSPTQDELGSELPEVDTEPPADGTKGPCPECGGPLTRINATAIVDEVLVYPRGRRLRVIAPYSPIPDDEPLYDAGWPVPTARSFPVLVLSAYVRPGRPVGPSDSSLNWTYQQAVDVFAYVAVQRQLESRNYYMLPISGVVDYKGERFEFRNDQFNVMYYASEFSPGDVHVLEGSTLDPEFLPVWDRFKSTLQEQRGLTDLGLTPPQLAEATASSISQTIQQNEIPLEHLRRRWVRALRPFVGVLWDYIRATYTPERLARLRLDDGVDLVAYVRGDELPNYDFVIDAAPAMTAIDKEKTQALDMLREVAKTDPDWLELYASVNKIPPSLTRKVMNKLAEIQQRAAAMTPPPPPDLGVVPAAAGPGVPGDTMGARPSPRASVDAFLQSMQSSPGGRPLTRGLQGVSHA